MTYRFLRTAGMKPETRCMRNFENSHLGGQQLEQWKRYLLTIAGLVGRHLKNGEWEEERVYNLHEQSSKSTSGPRFILLVTVWKMSRFSRRDGRGNSIFRSRRPGRSSAGSSVSARFVAMMT